jgi:branched-chain amino acid transport system substrate-binding protein
MRRIAFHSVLTAAALACGTSLSLAQTGTPVIIGVTFDAAKQASYYALLQKDALEVCAADTNEKGGVLGRPIKLQFEDDENNPAIGAQKAEKLAADGAVTVFQIGSSGVGLAVQRKAEELKLPNGSPANVAEGLTNPIKPWYFRISLRDSVATVGLISYLKKKYGEPTIAIVRDATETGLAVSDNQAKFVEQAGLKVVAKEQITPGTVDVTAQALRVKGSGAKVVLVIGASTADLANYIKAHKTVGNPAPMIGNNLFAVTTFPKLAGPAGEGFLVIDAVDMSRPDVKKLENHLIAKLGDRAKESSHMIAACEFLRLWVDAIGRAGSTDRAKVRDAMEATKDWPTLLGRTGAKVSFAADNHDAINSPDWVVLRIIKGGEFSGSIQD